VELAVVGCEHKPEGRRGASIMVHRALRPFLTVWVNMV